MSRLARFAAIQQMPKNIDPDKLQQIFAGAAAENRSAGVLGSRDAWRRRHQPSGNLSTLRRQHRHDPGGQLKTRWRIEGRGFAGRAKFKLQTMIRKQMDAEDVAKVAKLHAARIIRKSWPGQRRK